MFSMSTYWEWQVKGLRNRNYFILQELLKRPEIGKILSVDFLPFTWKRQIRYWLKDGRVKLVTPREGDNACPDCNGGSHYRLPKWTIFNKLFQPKKNLFIYNTGSNLISSQLFIQQIKKLLARLEFNDYILWSYNPMFVNGFKELPAKVKIFDAVDDWRKHSAYKNQQQRLTANYQTIASEADIIFTVAKSLISIFADRERVYPAPIPTVCRDGTGCSPQRGVKNDAIGLPAGLHWQPNGVDIKLFQNAIDQQKQKEVQEVLKNIPKPIAGYVGIIQDRLDFALIDYLAQHNPSISLVFLGWVWPEVQAEVEKLKHFNNIHFLGQTAYDLLPYYFQEFALGLVPHKINRFTETMNPLKFYEYLASGLPIVSTPVAGTEELAPYIKTAGGYSAFDQFLKQEIAKQQSANPQQLQTEKQERQKAAEKYSWEKRVREMMKKINF